MNQAELVTAIVNEVSQDRALSKADVNAVLKSLGDVVTKVLDGGDDVTLPGLGKFSTKDKPARTGRNPATGEAIEIAAKRVPAFSVSKVLKAAVAE